MTSSVSSIEAVAVEAQLVTSPVFEWNYNSTARICINQGGTSSGKTYAILQVIFMMLIQEKRICTVVGEDLPNLKKGAIRDFKDRILTASPWMNKYIAKYNKSEYVYTFTNGSILEFTSFSDSQDAKNGKRDISFFNEANGIPYPIYQQVAMRTTEKIFLDYNPSEEFWVHEHVAIEHNAVTYYSNFTHNPYVDPSVVEYLYQLKSREPETWRVYGLGITGVVSELVYPKYTVIDTMPRALKKRGYGMDFGYRADPTALVEGGLANERDVFLDLVFYGYQMKTYDIDERMVTEKVRRQLTIAGDGAEDRVIDDLQVLKWKIYPVTKGPGSIKYGINLLNDYNLHVTQRSVDLLNELRKYKYKTDKKTGKILNEPIDAWNHALDAARYYAMENLKPLRKGGGARRRN